MRSSPRSRALSDAQFAIARAYGFLSWAKFARHVDELQSANSSIGSFEAAADAVITGDLATLERLLCENPPLIHARSTREHRATLLHYTAANGVENDRQKTPANAVRITQTLMFASSCLRGSEPTLVRVKPDTTYC